MLTREKARHTLYEKLVFFWTDRTATSTRTKPYMSIEARTVGEFEFVVSAILKAPFKAAPFRTRRSADGHDTARDVDKVARGTRISIGTEIARVRLMSFARVFDSRKYIAGGKRDERIALVVLEVRVEIGRILLDEISSRARAIRARSRPRYIRTRRSAETSSGIFSRVSWKFTYWRMRARSCFALPT